MNFLRQSGILAICIWLNSTPMAWAEDDIYASEAPGAIGVATHVAEAVGDALASPGGSRYLPPSAVMVDQDLEKARALIMTALGAGTDTPRRFCIAADLAGSLGLREALPLIIDHLDLHWRPTAFASADRGLDDFAVARSLQTYGIPNLLDPLAAAMHHTRSNDWWLAVESLFRHDQSQFQAIRGTLTKALADANGDPALTTRIRHALDALGPQAPGGTP